MDITRNAKSVRKRSNEQTQIYCSPCPLTGSEPSRSRQFSRNLKRRCARAMPRLARAMPRLVRVITTCPLNALCLRMNLTPSAVLGRLIKEPSCVPMRELNWSLAKLWNHVLRDLFSTTFGEHIKDEGICEETSGEPLGSPLCGKTLAPILVKL